MTPNNPIVNIPANQIIAGNNDRTQFDPVALAELAESIGKRLVQPPTVRPMPSGMFQLIAGERRTRAMRDILKWEYIPCVVVECSDQDANDMMLAENTGRQDLDPIDEARAYQKRIDAGASVAEVSKSAGVSTVKVSNRVALLKLRPELQKLVRDGQVTVGYAQVICDFNLDTNRQMLAVKALRSSDHPTIGLLKTICSELATQQAQCGMDFGLFGDNPPTLPMQAKRNPPEVGKDSPARKMTFIKTIQAGYTFWTEAADDWKQLGRDNKARECWAAARSLADTARLMFGLELG